MPLKEGAGKKTIKQKQWQLYYIGYYGGKIDGIWRQQSKAAAVRFQKDYGLDADGIFGVLTIAKFIEIIKSIQKEITNGKIAIDGLTGQETKDTTMQHSQQIYEKVSHFVKKHIL